MLPPKPIEFLEESRMTKRTRYASVWDAIEKPKEAASLKARAAVANALIEELERNSMTQSRAAMLLGVTQPRISDLMRGRLELFSLDTLVDMAGRAGFRVGITLSRRRAA
jgi:predicted XRE-type DNA-binding protein